jgi:hypothetical protein
MGLLLLSVLSSPRAASPADTTYYIAPPGSSFTGTTNSNSAVNPVPYTKEAIRDIILGNPMGAGRPSVIIIFTPKMTSTSNLYTYRIDALAVTDIPAGRVLTIASQDQSNPITLQLVPPTATPVGFFNPPTWEQWLMVLVEDSYQTTTVNIRDLVLDANWPEWLRTSSTFANATSPAYVDAFALNALQVTASQGTIERVVIKNCGANGITPRPHWLTSGREGFPMMVIASKPTIDGNWGSDVEAAPWKIQNCEVYPLHGTHGGYCTSIMVRTPNQATADYSTQMDLHSTHRVAVVQRCQIRGNGLENGIGSVSSFGVTYRDNVLVGVGLGLNHDTGRQRNFTVENNAFLDVYGVAHVGGPNCSTDWYQHYAINNNLIRLRGVGYRQAYEDFYYTTITKGSFAAIQPYTDPSLAIGWMQPWACWGLWTGGANDLTFNGNRFTTRPRSVFYEPEPSQTQNARWRPVDALNTDPLTTMPRSFGTVNDTGNSLSTTYVGFWPTGGSWSSSVINNPTDERDALSQGFTSSQDAGFLTPFVPSGTVGRVVMEFFDEREYAGRLKGFREVCVSEPTFWGNTVTIRACTFCQHMVLDTVTQTSLETQGSSPQALQIALFAADGSVYSPASVSVGDVGNVRTFTITLPTALNQYYRAVVYRTSMAQPSVFNDAHDTWTAVEIHKGITLRFDRAQDVADDRQLKPGYLRLRRGGGRTSSFDFVLRVLLKGVDVNRRCATPSGPGFSGADFKLMKSNGALLYCNSGGQYTINFPQGATTMDLTVLPVGGTGDELEYEAAQFVLDYPAPSWGDYAIAPAVTGSTSFPFYTGANVTGNGFAVTLWDGPKYKFSRLNETYTCSGGGSSMLSSFAQAEGGEILTGEEAETMIAEGVHVETEPLALPTSRSSALDLPDSPALPDYVEPWATSKDLEVLQTGQSNDQDSELLMSNTTSTDLQSVATYAFAVNDTSTTPRVAGYATMNNSGGLCGLTLTPNIGGGWMATSYLEEMQRELLNGILYGVDNAGNHVGRFNSKAWYLPVAGGSGYELYPITTGYSGCAWWISPDGTKIAGASHKVVSGTPYTRPTLWTAGGGGNFATHDLGSFGGTSPTATGVAFMVNDYGVAVGRAKDGNYTRAFRDMYYDTTLDNKLDFVPAPHGTARTESEAYGVNSVGDVVGVSDTEVERNAWKSYTMEKRATLWWTSTYTPVPLGTVYPIDPNAPVNDPKYSEALAVNHMTRQVGAKTIVTTMVVGSSYTTPTAPPSGGVYAAAFAVLDVPSASDSYAARSSINMVNLNDAHLTYFPPPLNRAQWNLKSAEAINNQGVIVGNGTWHQTNPYDASAQQWGWILIPQTEAQP